MTTIFKPIEEIYTIQSKWILSFALKLDAYEAFLLKVGQDILALDSLIRKSLYHSLHVTPQHKKWLQGDMYLFHYFTLILHLGFLACVMSDADVILLCHIESPLKESIQLCQAMYSELRWSRGQSAPFVSFIPPGFWVLGFGTSVYFLLVPTIQNVVYSLETRSMCTCVQISHGVIFYFWTIRLLSSNTRIQGWLPW